MDITHILTLKDSFTNGYFKAHHGLCDTFLDCDQIDTDIPDQIDSSHLGMLNEDAPTRIIRDLEIYLMAEVRE